MIVDNSRSFMCKSPVSPKYAGGFYFYRHEVEEMLSSLDKMNNNVFDRLFAAQEW